MKLQQSQWVRGMVVMALLVGSALAAGLLAVSDPALAQSAADTPPAPAPLNPPLTTPEAPAGAAPANASGLQVRPFQPAFRIALGDQPPAAGLGAQGVKPETPAGTDAPAPAFNAPAADLRSVITSQDWAIVFYDTFDDFFFPNTFYTDWITFTNSTGVTWKDVSVTDRAYSGAWSAWPAYGGPTNNLPANGYPNDVNSWMVQGPFNFTGKTDVFVGFNLWYQTEPSYDWLYLCVSVAGVNGPYDCNNYWSGSSVTADNPSGWTNQNFWLTSYAGYSSVYIAWFFYSDSSIAGDYGYAGPYVDDVYIWDYSAPPPPTPDASGQLIRNPSFETGTLANWSTAAAAGRAGAALAPDSPAPADRPALEGQPVQPLDVSAQSVTVTDTTRVDGLYSARMARADDGADFLYQPIFISSSVTALTLNYWYGLTTLETVARSDFFCASLRPYLGGGNLSGTVLVDLGCVDAINATGYWQEVLLNLTAAQLAAVKGQTVDLVFELYNTTDVGQPLQVTHNYVDYVWAYVTDTNLANALDPHEPNNDAASATPLLCNTVITDGVIGDALGGGDVDWYVVPAWQGLLTLDVNARTRLPASALDSVLTVYDAGFNQVAYNDDDGVTFDSFITATVPLTGSTYYVALASYSGAGGPDYTYELSADCGQAVAAPAPANVAPPPADTWTVMLYLNAEDSNFESILQGYITALQNTVVGKQAFLNITVLYDGPGATGTTRYLIQPNGSYTDGVNRWALGERNMGDPATLAEFVTWSMDLYPAENYYLAIDDHGDGVYGMSVDGTSNNDQLTPREIYSAIKDATRNGERKIDLFDYEACLMGLAENAYDLREWVDYVIFSQQISWGISTYPVYFADLAASDTPRAVGQRIVARYSAGATAAQYPHTISLIDTSRMPALRAATDTFAAALTAQLAGNAAGVRQARGATQSFAASLQQATNPDFAEYLDLYDLAAQAASRGLVTPAVAAAVQSEVTQAVVAERHVSGGVRVGNTTFNWNHANAHGLSLYYPPDRASPAFAGYVESAPRLYQMGDDGGWDEFLAAAVPSLNGAGGVRGGMSSSRAQDRLMGGQTFLTINMYLPLIRR